MKKPSKLRAVVAGIGVAAVYLLAAFVSGRLSVLARRPLLDGFTPPPPYRYVTPPADAATKEKPDAGSFSVSLAAPELGAGVFSTKDMQATLVLEPGVFPEGTTGPVAITITPLDPAGLGKAASGTEVVGNAYRIEATSKSGAGIDALVNAGHVVLVYPAPSGEPFAFKHALLRLDGSRWISLKSNDTPNAQQASADVQSLGTFAVGRSSAKPVAKGPNPAAVAGGVVAGLAVAGGVAWYLLARRRDAKRRKMRKPGSKRPSPPKGRR